MKPRSSRKPVHLAGVLHAFMLVVAVSLVAMLPACSSFHSGKPRVADSTLVSALADLHLVRARQQLGYTVPPGLRDSILASHGMTARQYRHVVSYFAEHPDEYADLYSRVLDQVLMEQDRSRQPVPAAEHDSAAVREGTDPL
ncbi:MAG TPA: DUF4296 domain-containing protein [Rhodothermales bacterium]|nr:DUF4296 domain-containing protein [Rhodothermales bacterium]